MKEFKIANNELNINIGTVKFKCDPIIAESHIGKAKKCIEQLNTAVSNGSATSDIIENAIKELCDNFEELAGKGSIRKILNKNIVSFHDMCDIFVYLRKAAEEFEQRKAEFYEYYDKNRAQRRGAVRR